MRVMVIRKADKETEAGIFPEGQAMEDLLDAMGKYNEKMIKAGVMLDGAGLHPSSKGARVSFSNGKPTVIDGPFSEAKELIAGYSILQVQSLEEAIEWVKGWPPLDAGGEAQIEIRQLYEMDDFGDSPAAERMREMGKAAPQ